MGRPWLEKVVCLRRARWSFGYLSADKEILNFSSLCGFQGKELIILCGGKLIIIVMLSIIGWYTFMLDYMERCRTNGKWEQQEGRGRGQRKYILSEIWLMSIIDWYALCLVTWEGIKRMEIEEDVSLNERYPWKCVASHLMSPFMVHVSISLVIMGIQCGVYRCSIHMFLHCQLPDMFSRLPIPESGIIVFVS